MEAVEDTSNTASPNRVTFGVASLIPTPDRDKIDGTTPWQSYEYYDGDVTQDGIIYHKFKPVQSFTIEVPTESVLKIIGVDEDKPYWKKTIGTGRNDMAHIFCDWVLPHLPKHIALSFNRQVNFLWIKDPDGQKKRRGCQRVPGSIAIGYNDMYCTAKKSMGCPTKIAVGFTDASIKPLLDSSSWPEMVKLLVDVSNACLHKKGQEYGRSSGTSRTNAVDNYLDSKMAPAEFAKKKLDEASDARLKLFLN